VFSLRTILALMISAFLMTSPAIASHVHRAPTSGQPVHRSLKSTPKSVKSTQSSLRFTKRSHRSIHVAHRTRGQQGIQPERVTEIQQALIREHYLTGEATGNWDAATQAAMQKYQADQGWQTRLAPDSRALKKLGLGPDYSNAINAKDSTFAPPPPVSTIPTEQAVGFAAAAGVNP
jgi:peptidoglycan hydrolase-like protein with peptidoglycan-binding domain